VALSTDAATVFAALGDPVRLSIIARLCDDGPLPTIHLKQGTSLSRQAVTKHLRILEEVGLVRSRRVGRDRSWQIEARQLAMTRAYLDRMSAQWDTRLVSSVSGARATSYQPGTLGPVPCARGTSLKLVKP
jgi:DNA-binding transcriptional ArsR family regulator